MFANQSSSSYPEELILYGLLVVIGAIPVAVAVAERTTFGVEATIGLLMVCAGVIGAIFYALRALDNPGA
jgi:hypothetical protein